LRHFKPSAITITSDNQKQLTVLVNDKIKQTEMLILHMNWK